MAIEITDQMVYAFAGEPEITATDAHAIRVGLAAVLAIVERDYDVRCGSAYTGEHYSGGFGCDLKAGHDGDHRNIDGDHVVFW